MAVWAELRRPEEVREFLPSAAAAAGGAKRKSRGWWRGLLAAVSPTPYKREQSPRPEDASPAETMLLRAWVSETG
jgi:hypothetical protein